jgi:dienelactone hydrolase
VLTLLAAVLLALGAGVAYLLSRATIAIPRPSGPHAVGFTSMTISDLSRPVLLSTVTLDIWYPASSTAGHRAAPYNEAALRGALATYQGIPASLNRETPSYAFQDAPVLGGQHPVVIFNHGYGSFSKQNTSNAQELASHGYLVLSLAHPGDSLIAQDAEGEITQFDGQDEVYQQLRASQNTPAFAVGLATHLAAQRLARTHEAHMVATQELSRSLPYSLLGPLRQRWLDDTRLVIARLSEAGPPQSEGNSILSSADASKVTVMGHSFGGVTALDIARRPPPGVVQVINLDGPWLEAASDGGSSFPDLNSDHTLKVPVLALLSTQNIQRRQDLGLHGTFDTPLSRGLYGSHVTEIAGTAHMNFTDLNFIPVLRWVSPLLGRVDNRRMARLMNRAILEFLSRDPASAAFSAPLLPAEHDLRQQFFPPAD